MMYTDPVAHAALHDTFPIWYQGILPGRNPTEEEMGKQDRTFITNMARTIMGQAKISSESFPAGQTLGPQLYKKYGGAIQRLCQAWSNEALGRVAAYGIGTTTDDRHMSMHEVHMSTHWLTSAHHSGTEILLRLATTVIVAAIADEIRSDGRRTGRVAWQKPIGQPSFTRPDIARAFAEDAGRRGGTPESLRAPGLDGYEGRRDRFPDGSLTHTEGGLGGFPKD